MLLVTTTVAVAEQLIYFYIDTIQLELSSLDTLPMCKLVVSHTPDPIHDIMSEFCHTCMYANLYMPSTCWRYLSKLLLSALEEARNRVTVAALRSSRMDSRDL